MRKAIKGIREKKQKKGSSRKHAMEGYLLRLRKTSCLFMDRNLAISSGSSRACSIALAI